MAMNLVESEVYVGMWDKAAELLKSNSEIRGERWWTSKAKRKFDINFARLMMPVILGVVGIGGGWVWLTDGKEPVVRLKRWHPKGEVGLLKIRTMVSNAQERDEEVFGGRPLRETKINGNDPRILPGCRWLRMSSLDEMPQFINVLKGKMSVVGSRPISDYEIGLELEPNREFEPYHEWEEWLAKGLKFGITGLSQVLTRRACPPMGIKMEIENLYARESNLAGDIRIILATLAPGVIFGGR